MLTSSKLFTPRHPVLATPKGARPEARACSHRPSSLLGPGLSSVASVLLLLGQPQDASALAAPTSSSPKEAMQTLRGPARVVDGDTLYIGEEKIRLYGVDAPEKGQQCNDKFGNPYACGLISKDKLLQKVGTQPVTCEPKQRDQYQRAIAICSLEGPAPEDLNGWMVQNGLAVAYREYSKDYIPTEEAAQRAHRGIWDGTFQYPADWRKAEKAKGSNSAEVQGLPRAIPPPDIAVPYIPPPSPPQAQGSPTAAAQPGSCGPTAPIKGNISAKGERIYHLPGGTYYNRVVIEPEKGEKCFASEADALKEGFRAAGN
ncbi:high light-induced nuclease [Dunaliella salina]|uniref:High light-induced nuclease n=1 Tax=Dunaliella salina TaxID=3046 RepID=A0ABQ7GJZ2_DUNSA|nr:high light-induced nuclease [Dunaliella salina]|eukprot:KAF5834922.1 high light-induced nuclease [Dunaliella salina]